MYFCIISCFICKFLQPAVTKAITAPQHAIDAKNKVCCCESNTPPVVLARPVSPSPPPP